MNEFEERLEVLCQAAALLILQHPERSQEVEGEIATAFHVQPQAVHNLVLSQISHLSQIEGRQPVQHA